MAAARIPESFLDELRAALPVSDVVRRRIPDLRRKGSEWVCLSPFQKENTPSFTINDDKRLWKDFSSDKGGDIFKFEMLMTSCTFVEAVRNLAELAGLRIPGDGGGGAPAPASRDEPPPAALPPRRQGPAPKREITATYDYTDADGGLLYQVCRIEWEDDDGSRKKTFTQRRRAPDSVGGGWIMGLGAGVYVRGRTGDWYRLTKDRAHWDGARLEVSDEVDHGLYRFQQLREEMAQPEDERRVVFCPEGEKDCDTLAAWGLIATDSSGGSKKWSPHHAEALRDADVVVLADNDASGLEYAHRKASSLRGIARRVRLLDWKMHWARCPEGGDVTDWRDIAGGDRDKLLAILDRLPAWAPVAPASTFNAVRYIDLDLPARELEWLIKKVLTRGEVSIWYGVPGCGKSFLLTDAAMSVARGVSWFGLRVRPGLVIYQAGEGGLGIKKRLRAYRQYHRLAADDDVPFVLLPSRIDLFNADVDVEKLIAEIRAWSAFYDVPLEMVVIDTFSAATPGANENASEDVSKVLQRAHRIASDCRCHVALVHHTPKGGGSPRGHSSLQGNVENMIEVIRNEAQEAEVRPDGSRLMRDRREFRVTKQKDGEDGMARAFVLRQVVMGKDEDGEDKTSCVVDPLSGGTASADTPKVIPRGYADLSPNNTLLMRALARALARVGTRPPEGIPGPPMGTPSVRVADWIDALVDLRFQNDPDDPDGKRLRARCKKAIERAHADYGWADRERRNLIVKEKEWVWRTSRKVNGVDPPPPSADVLPFPRAQDALIAPGEDLDSLSENLI